MRANDPRKMMRTARLASQAGRVGMGGGGIGALIFLAIGLLRKLFASYSRRQRQRPRQAKR